MVVKIMVPIRVILGLYWGYMEDNGKENWKLLVWVIWVVVKILVSLFGSLLLRGTWKYFLLFAD